MLSCDAGRRGIVQQRRTGVDSSGAAGGGVDPEPLLSVSLALKCHCGHKREGRAVLLPRWPSQPENKRLAEGEDFRIVILSEPPEGSISPAEGVVVSSPARRFAPAIATREPAAT